MQPKFVHRFAVVVAVLIVVSVSFVSIKLIAQAKQDQLRIERSERPLDRSCSTPRCDQRATAIEPLDRIAIAQPAGVGYPSE